MPRPTRRVDWTAATSEWPVADLQKPMTMLTFLLLSLLTTEANATSMDRSLHPELQRYVNERVLPAVATIPAERCWSKKYDDAPNPQQDFCAVMTCSEADKNCPIVFGALDRISLPYNDPKEADGTPEEAARYDERCLQIAAELWYVMQQASK